MDAQSAGKTRALGRAKAAAWMVALSMAATTMAFQVYHSIIYGRMPWELAVLFGVVPLVISVLVLEFVAQWEQAGWWAKSAAYLIMGGAMYLSAASTGDVVFHAAPVHMSWLFGVLLDGAALLAVHFILNGPRAADIARAAAAETAARSKREAELLAAAEAARTAHTADVSALREELETERAARESAQREASEALTRAQALAAKAATMSAQGPRKIKAASAQASGDGDVTTELRALMELRADPELCKPRMGGELARRLGVSAATGRRLHSRLTHQGALNQEVTGSLTEWSE